MATLGDDVRFLAWEPEGEAEGFEADGALVVVVGATMGDNWEGGHPRLGVGVDGGSVVAVVCLLGIC
jgi:hypothetical protein